MAKRETRHLWLPSAKVPEPVLRDAFIFFMENYKAALAGNRELPGEQVYRECIELALVLSRVADEKRGGPQP